VQDALDLGIVMFLALFALYSPVAALSSYLPIVGRMSDRDKRRLALGLFTNVAIFAMAAIWLGEPLLDLLGITTAALSVTGGIALLYASIPMMRGLTEVAPHGPDGDRVVLDEDDESGAGWRPVLFTPVTFPLTVGGTTFGLLVAFASEANSAADHLSVTVAGLAYALVTGITMYLAGKLDRRLSDRSRVTLERIAGIVLTAIAVSLLASGATRMVLEVLDGEATF